ncbi:MAG TPA: SMI1/KNR4 family protein [Humisphaera sp.]
MQCVQLSGSDNRLDCRDMFDSPINLLPPRCAACGFPDLDFVPQPYLIGKSRAMTSNEAALAAYGNLLVRGRVRRVLELVVPDACRFYPTAFKGHPGEPEWSLAVPAHAVPTGKVKDRIKRCLSCSEPRSSHPGTQWDHFTLGTDADLPHDLFKSATWASSELGWDRWMDRNVFMSERMFGLLERLGVKGLVETLGTAATRKRRQTEFAGWIDEQVALLERAGVATRPAGTLSADVAARYKTYLKEHAAGGKLAFDRKAAERRLGFALPKSVVDYFGTVGPRAFDDVDGQEGFTARILPVGKWDVKGFRGRSEELLGDVDGVMFAATDHGDCFCLDVGSRHKEPPVYQYMHEGDFLEPYTDSFAECVLRFAAGERE